MSRECIFQKSVKRFLTDDHQEFGTMCYFIASDRYAESTEYHMNCSLRIQDCYETINLDFHVGTSRSRFDRRIAKVQHMIDILQEMKDMLEYGFELTEQQNKILEDKMKEDVDSKTSS